MQPSDSPSKPTITLEVQSPVSVFSSVSNIDLRMESNIDDQLKLPEPEAEKRQDAASEIEDQADKEIAPTWDDSASRHFSLGEIGGKPSPMIEDAVLNHIADSMGYFLAEQPGNRLDMVASAKKTAEQCGMVSLRFSRRKKLRSLVILEDAFAEPREWNPIATELAEGMLARGVSVLHGRFYGAAEQFKTEDGATYRIEDLEDEREGLLLLLFTDGKSFCRSEQRFDLERLACWPAAAWMELREHKFWDQSSEIPVQYGIPVYPATSTGIQEAMKAFLTESGLGSDYSVFATRPAMPPNLATSQLEPYVEYFLGDALLWAQDCAMAIQPISRGMADALRNKFHPCLPVERIGRLHLLPETEYNHIGLRFSDDMMKVLRQGFMVRRSEKEQDEVLQFILEKVAECEPEDKSGLAHMTWESVKERVRVECEMNADLQRLVELSKTPLAGYILRSLEDFGLPGQTGKIPLRIKTKSPNAMQMIADIPGILSGMVNQYFYEGESGFFSADPNTLRDRYQMETIDSAPSRKRYLQEVASIVGNLPWDPVDPDYGDATCSAGGEKSITLADIYISPDTREFDKPPETEDQVRRHMELKEEESRISAQDMANRESRLVLLGDPGAGKSTLVNYLAYAMANAGLEKGSGRWLDKLKESGEWDSGVLLPVRVLLREFADNLRKRKPERGGADLLRDHLKGAFQASEYADYWGPFYDGLLEPEPDLPYLVLLDGLDEVPSDLRQVAMESIEAFAKKYSAHRYIVTCRIYAYIGKGQQLKGFKQATLMPFDQERIDAFVDFWYSKLAKLGRFTEKEAGERKEGLQKATRRPDLFGLARRPLLMTAMAMLHSFRGQLPDDRVELYRSTVDLLLRRWESRVGGEKALLETLDVPGLKMKTLESALYDVAFEMHGSAEPEAETADISEGMLMGIVKKRLGDFRKAEIFLDYVRTRAGLLVCHRPDTFAFPHRTFQEFMAACHLVESENYPVESVELIKEDLRKWRVVFVLAARRAAIGQGLSAINNLCPVSVGEAESTDAAAFRHAEVAAEALMEIGAFEVEQKDLGKLVAGRVRNWLARALVADGILDAKERASAGTTLALLGDARAEIMTLDKMEFCLVPGGDFVMSENDDPKEILSHLQYPFWMGRFPVTNAQFRFFMDAGGYAEERLWEEAVRNKVWRDGMVKGRLDDEPRNHPQIFAGPYGLPNHPVVGVTWYEAMAFARWLESHWRERELIPGDWHLYLPTEAQWEKAARGGLKVPVRPVILTANEVVKCDVTDVLINSANSARKYPWGDELDSEKMNIKETGIGTTSTQGCFSSGKSPCGCEDMSGNVWEWTRSERREYPYKPKDGREDSSLFTNDTGISDRGGAFYSRENASRCGFRRNEDPNDHYQDIGFRILLSPP